MGYNVKRTVNGRFVLRFFQGPVIDWVASGCLYGRFRFGIAAKLRFLRQPDGIGEFSTVYSCIVEIDKVAPGTYQGITAMKNTYCQQYWLSQALRLEASTPQHQM